MLRLLCKSQSSSDRLLAEGKRARKILEEIKTFKSRFCLPWNSYWEETA